MRAKEFTKPGTITLDQIYDGQMRQMPDSDEHIWNYVSPNDFNIPFTINTIQPMVLRNILEIQYGVDDIEDLFHKMHPEQEEIIQHYTNDSDLSKQIIILHKDRIIDGNHRALAAALAKKPIRYIDVSEDIEEVNEEYTKDGKYVIRAMTYEDEFDDVNKFVKNRLKASGYKFIGSGYDAQVWMKDEGTVVKILLPKEDNTAHDTFKTFYQLSKKLNSPNLPKFKQVDGREVYNFTINDQPFVQYGMEQLYPLEKGSLDEYVVWNLADYSAKQMDWTEVVDSIKNDSGKGIYPNAEKLQKEFVAQNTSKLKEYEIFYNTLRKLHKVGNSKGYGWDPHTENVMRRSDGTLVITDPWA